MLVALALPRREEIVVVGGTVTAGRLRIEEDGGRAGS
jgi:hypothetical protein